MPCAGFALRLLATGSCRLGTKACCAIERILAKLDCFIHAAPSPGAVKVFARLFRLLTLLIDVNEAPWMAHDVIEIAYRHTSAYAKRNQFFATEACTAERTLMGVGGGQMSPSRLSFMGGWAAKEHCSSVCTPD